MSTGLIFDNLVAYSLQIGWLVGVAAVIPTVLRLRAPGAKLLYWQILLAVCLLLPLQPWKQAVSVGSVEVTTVITAVHTAPRQPAAPAMPRSEMVLLLMLGGSAIRLAWLAVGFWKLRRYRRHSQALDPAPAWGVEASLLISDEISSPVTFGWRKPVVLLPSTFPAMGRSAQDAILCHEVMHVRRGDWLFTVAEELVRAVFWFHPAIWWLLGEIGLAREQEVDRLAIEITNEREEYMDALLAIAGARMQLDLAPAPLFLRKRHLKHRMVSILKETRMSKKHLISTLATGFGALAAACWLVTGAFPLTAEPQVVYDAPGVTVTTNGAALMHRTGVNYPTVALQRGVQGTLSVEVKLDATGNVIDARVLSGPDELRRSALESVLQWHFARELAGTTRVVGINYETPPQATMVLAAPPQSVSGVVGGAVGGIRGNPGVVGGVLGGVSGGVPQGVLGGIIGPVPANGSTSTQAVSLREMQINTAMQGGPIKSIRIAGLSQQASAELLASLPVHEGDQLTPETLQRVTQAAKAYDEHLQVQRTFSVTPGGTLETSLLIASPGAETMAVRASAPMQAASPGRLMVGGNVQSTKILRKVSPVYPQLALSARVSGVVHLAAVIAKDGTIQELHALGGPALLIQAALDAVRQWVYQPTMLKGEPVSVETTIDVNFTLAEQ